MSKISNITWRYDRIYVYYSRGQITGGPEALHQLVDSLRRQGSDAYLVPLPATRHVPRAEAYAHYDAPECSAVDDSSRNAVVAPETFLEGLNSLQNATAFLWWLSVDNSPIFRLQSILATARQDKWTLEAVRRASREAWVLFGRKIKGKHAKVPKFQHLAQSHYAHAVVFTRYALVSQMLTDYTHDMQESSPPRPTPTRPGERIVIAYNPAKGGKELSKARRELEDTPIDWVGLTGMTKRQVAESLASAHIYLDLGHHPGKDRMPREAAMQGALVLVAARGSAAFSRDVPIPEAHKIACMGEIGQEAARVVRKVIPRLGAEVELQNTYREAIRGERGQFDAEVLQVFAENALSR